MTKFFGDVRDKFLGLDDEDVKADVTPLMDIMKKDVYTISCDAPVIDALRLMRDKKVSGCPVIDNENNLVGFISDGDIIRQLTSEHSLFVNSHSFEKIQFNNSLSNMITKKVSEFATQKIITVNINDDLDEVCYKLGENRLKKAPVMENGKMVGIINVSNIIKYAADLMEKEM